MELRPPKSQLLVSLESGLGSWAEALADKQPYGSLTKNATDKSVHGIPLGKSKFFPLPVKGCELGQVMEQCLPSAILRGPEVAVVVHPRREDHKQVAGTGLVCAAKGGVEKRGSKVRPGDRL